MNKKLESFLHWLPKVLNILLIFLFILLSGDIFDLQLGFWGTILGLLIHNIPTYIIIAVLVFAWRRPIVGAISFIVLDFFYFFSFNREYLVKLPLTLMVLVIAFTFFISHKRSKYYWANRKQHGA